VGDRDESDRTFGLLTLPTLTRKPGRESRVGKCQAMERRRERGHERGGGTADQGEKRKGNEVRGRTEEGKEVRGEEGKGNEVRGRTEEEKRSGERRGRERRSGEGQRREKRSGKRRGREMRSGEGQRREKRSGEKRGRERRLWEGEGRCIGGTGGKLLCPLYITHFNQRFVFVLISVNSELYSTVALLILLISSLRKLARHVDVL